MPAESDPENLLAWLPKVHESKPVPGGVIWCQQWDINAPPGNTITGEIVFRFEVSREEYKKVFAAPARIPPVMAIEANKEPTCPT